MYAGEPTADVESIFVDLSNGDGYMIGRVVMSLKKLRDAFASAFDSHDPEEEVLAACPSSEKLYQASHGELPPDEIAKVTDHMAECPLCAEAYRLARATVPPPSARQRGPND